MIIIDKRTSCLSAMVTTNIYDYIQLAEKVYSNRGGIEGQRAPLKTKTGIRIRKRMVEDIAAGTILPPLVLGVILTEEDFEKSKELPSPEDLISFMQSQDSESISIIDGMQRTTAIIEAMKSNNLDSQPLRIEIWIAKSINNLIYRMLVLNTGQVPWDMKRQLETVYQPILKEIKKEIPNINVLLLDDSARRVQASQYQSSKLIELFLAFTSKKINIDIKEKIAEDFARMEAAEATSKENFLKVFILVLALLNSLDISFDKFKRDEHASGRIKSGKDIFSSSPAGIGFMASAAVYIYGPPGFNLENEKIDNNIAKLKKSLNGLIEKLNSRTPEEVGEFLDLITLNEKLGTRSGKVGDFEREFFMKAFTALIEYGEDLQSMEPCWVAL